MIPFYLRLPLAIFLLLLLALMPALLLRFLGHEVRVDWNENAAETRCEIVDHYTVERTCSETCDCYTYSCGRSAPCYSCSTCYYTCYDGYVTVEYWAGDYQYTDSIDVATERSQASALAEAREEYPLDSESACYYQTDDATDWRFELHNTTGYLVGFWIFVALGIIGASSYIAFEVQTWCQLLNCIRDPNITQH